jgi:hypothetical protein
LSPFPPADSRFKKGNFRKLPFPLIILGSTKLKHPFEVLPKKKNPASLLPVEDVRSEDGVRGFKKASFSNCHDYY